MALFGRRPPRLVDGPSARRPKTCTGSETLAESTTSPEQVPPTYAKPFRQGHKNDFRDAHAVAEAVQRPTTRFVPAKTNEQLDLQALHRVRSRLVSERTAVINQIRGFLLERGIIVRQGLRFLRQLLPDILAKRTDVLSPRMVRTVSDLAGGWRQHDERIETVTDEIEAVAKSNDSCRKVMTVPGIGPIISSAMVAAIGSGAAFARGRDFSAWLGLVPKQMSTGDRTILGRISKRGNGYLRMLFMQTARVILLRPANWPGRQAKRNSPRSDTHAPPSSEKARRSSFWDRPSHALLDRENAHAGVRRVRPGVRKVVNASVAPIMDRSHISVGRTFHTRKFHS